MPDTTTTTLRTAISRLQGKRDQIAEDLSLTQAHLATALDELHVTEVARALIQRAAHLTQSQIRYRVTALGTMAMEAVFPEKVKLGLEFRENMGKVEAHLTFEREGEDGLSHPLDPLEEDSGGACNVAGLGLRVSMWAAQRPRTRPIFVMDEPGHDLNDRTRRMHEKFAEVIREVGESELGVQFLIVTMIEELEEVGEKIQLRREKGD